MIRNRKTPAGADSGSFGPARIGHPIAHAAEWLGLSRSALYKLIKAGLGPRTYTVGRRRYVSLQAGIAWQRAQEVGPKIVDTTWLCHCRSCGACLTEGDPPLLCEPFGIALAPEMAAEVRITRKHG